MHNVLLVGAASLLIIGHDAASAALFDRGGGLIYDSVLNVTWLQDANYAKTSGYDSDGRMTWSEATNWVSGLQFYDEKRKVYYDDWRLPTAGPVNGDTYVYSWSYDGSSDWGYNIAAPGSVYAGSTTNEMAHLFYISLGNQGLCDAATSTRSTCQQLESGWGTDSPGPFINIQADLADSYYWTGTRGNPDFSELT
ncbi:DUF1566 domain-containing protein [Azoarcus sp. PA01]|nr:DUF1566 domain-containing protein [Azoarcus sp. PA01]